jgi:hypothetical protein
VDLAALRECLDEEVRSAIYAGGATDHPVVNNTDASTLYRSQDILDLLAKSGTSLFHNVYTRPESCPEKEWCILQTLAIEFITDADAKEWFDLATGSGGLEGQVEIPVPGSETWDKAVCATGSRASTQAGAPDFSVLYCTVDLVKLSYGFNASAYTSLPDGWPDEKLPALLDRIHTKMDGWRTAH